MESSKQSKFLKKLILFTYFSGNPYFWFEQCEWPLPVIKFLKYKNIVLKIPTCIFFLLTGFSPLLTQKNLSEQQTFDILMYNITFPLFYLITISVQYYEEDVKKLIYELVVSAPSIYKDPRIETEMIGKAYTLFMLITCIGWSGITMIMLGGLIRSLTTEEVFTTVVSAWPDVQDKSLIATVIRLLVSIMWIVLILQCNGTLALVVCLIVYTSHQFKQLQSYFCSLTIIFQEDLSQVEKEEKYEKSLKIGFKLHRDIISSTRRLVKTCNIGYGGEIFMNVMMLSIIMIRLANQEKVMVNILTDGLIAMTILTVTGMYMSTLGDITIEADKLTTSMYMSGWENCGRSSSVRVRTLLSISMAQTQKPLTIYALGIIVVSFSSFVSIVKFSYTIFSVIM